VRRTLAQFLFDQITLNKSFQRYDEIGHAYRYICYDRAIFARLPVYVKSDDATWAAVVSSDPDLQELL